MRLAGPLDPQVYSVPFVPFQANVLDAVWIAATLIPACAASRILPVDILRYE